MYPGVLSTSFQGVLPRIPTKFGYGNPIVVKEGVCGPGQTRGKTWADCKVGRKENPERERGARNRLGETPNKGESPLKKGGSSKTGGPWFPRGPLGAPGPGPKKLGFSQSYGWGPTKGGGVYISKYSYYSPSEGPRGGGKNTGGPRRWGDPWERNPLILGGPPKLGL